VLKLKKDMTTHVGFLDEAMKVRMSKLHSYSLYFNMPQVLENKPSTVFWACVGRSLERTTKDSVKGVFSVG
jgi:conserved oligomeric Golgi complex subunit 5